MIVHDTNTYSDCVKHLFAHPFATLTRCDTMSSGTTPLVLGADPCHTMYVVEGGEHIPTTPGVTPTSMSVHTPTMSHADTIGYTLVDNKQLGLGNTTQASKIGRNHQTKRSFQTRLGTVVEDTVENVHAVVHTY